MTRISNLQSSRNLDSRQAWDCFAGHRNRVTKLLKRLTTGDEGSLCVLGAGNCNDLELGELLDSYASIQLVDLDGDALAAGVERQAIEGDGLRLIGDADVTGVVSLLSQWSPERPVGSAEVDHCLAGLDRASSPVEGPFDVTASVCLLSQLIESVVLSLGEQHPRFVELLTAIRFQHFRQLLDLTAPGGAVAVVTDIVSSETCPELLQVGEETLPQLVSNAINARNFFTGVNPVVLGSLFARDPALSPRVQSVEISNPWCWDLGPRVYAVCAVLVRLQT